MKMIPCCTMVSQFACIKPRGSLVRGFAYLEIGHLEAVNIRDCRGGGWKLVNSLYILYAGVRWESEEELNKPSHSRAKLLLTL